MHRVNTKPHSSSRPRQCSWILELFFIFIHFLLKSSWFEQLHITSLHEGFCYEMIPWPCSTCKEVEWRWISRLYFSGSFSLLFSQSLVAFCFLFFSHLVVYYSCCYQWMDSVAKLNHIAALPDLLTPMSTAEFVIYQLNSENPTPLPNSVPKLD